MTHLMIHDGENNGIFYSVDDTIYFITHRYVGMYLLLYVYISEIIHATALASKGLGN